MESLRENKALLYSLIATGGFIALLALGWIPELSDQFGIFDFPDEVSNKLLNLFHAMMSVYFLFFFLSVPFTPAASPGHRLFSLAHSGQAVPICLWRGQTEDAAVMTGLSFCVD
jgi:hypothetical protein